MIKPSVWDEFDIWDFLLGLIILIASVTLIIAIFSVWGE